MLFDLRGRGRRRTIQAIYLSLAVLMGGGLVLFGIGGNTSGGLFDAFKSGGGASSNAGDVFTKRLETLQKRTQANPTDQAALVSIARLRFQLAGTGENYNQTAQAYTVKGRQQLGQAADAWQRYLALSPAKPDATVASMMVQAYGQAGLQRYDKAVQAMELVIDSRAPTAALYAQLAILASGAKQDRKSTLSEDKALSLTPKAQRATLKQQIDAAKTQLTAVPESTPSSG
jgi:hypothetical protein